jgi:hypothetical protein
MHEQHGIYLRRGQHYAQGILVAAYWCITNDVNGVAARPGGRQVLAEVGQGLRAQLGELAAA